MKDLPFCNTLFEVIIILGITWNVSFYVPLLLQANRNSVWEFGKFEYPCAVETSMTLLLGTSMFLNVIQMLLRVWQLFMATPTLVTSPEAVQAPILVVLALSTLYIRLVRILYVHRSLKSTFNIIYRQHNPSLNCLIIIFQTTFYTGKNKALSMICGKPAINPFLFFHSLEK